jgi:ferredoxin
VRKAGLNIMMSLKGDGKPVSFIEDCAVPLAHLAEYTAALTDVFERNGTHGTWYAHASVGTLHVRPILDMRRDGAQKMRRIAGRGERIGAQIQGRLSAASMATGCAGANGSPGSSVPAEDALRAIKREMDPINLFSPNRIIDPPRMDDTTAVPLSAAGKRASLCRAALETVLDWSDWNVRTIRSPSRPHRPAAAAIPRMASPRRRRCATTMAIAANSTPAPCAPAIASPATSRHLTRGRANSLRLALSGTVGRGALTSRQMFDTLDLCVSCKGCKRECPTGVDMAKMKVEFLPITKAAWLHA